MYFEMCALCSSFPLCESKRTKIAGGFVRRLGGTVCGYILFYLHTLCVWGWVGCVQQRHKSYLPLPLAGAAAFTAALVVLP